MAEEKRSVWKSIGQILIDIPEKYVSSITFSILFIVFVLQIFFRYVLNRPLVWPYEVSIFAFIWTVMLGACYAKRHNVHVKFNLVYDRQKPLVQTIFRIIGNTAIVTAFCIALFPTYKFIQFMRNDRSVDLKIPFDIAFGPYLVFMVIIIVRVAIDLVNDVRRLVKGEVE
jgi:TRAP-type C4-dicarboxylate transport system permease small subunit